MTTLLLGASGLAGQAFARELNRRGMAWVGAARHGAELALDICDQGALRRTLDNLAPALVVNAAALVDIGLCTRDPDLCWRVNARPLQTLSEWSRTTNRPLVQISTDHYYTDGADRGHLESDPIRLVNDYAAAKYAGEALALTAPEALVLRTSIVGLRGWDRPTFAEWALDAVANDREITLFSDAWTSSMDVGRFARAALELCLERHARGLYNLAAREIYTKEAFVREMARQAGHPLNHAVVGSVHGVLADRATCLGLDVTRAAALLADPLPDLSEVVAAVLAQKREHTE